MSPIPPQTLAPRLIPIPGFLAGPHDTSIAQTRRKERVPNLHIVASHTIGHCDCAHFAFPRSINFANHPSAPNVGAALLIRRHGCNLFSHQVTPSPTSPFRKTVLHLGLTSAVVIVKVLPYQDVCMMQQSTNNQPKLLGSSLVTTPR